MKEVNVKVMRGDSSVCILLKCHRTYNEVIEAPTSLCADATHLPEGFKQMKQSSLLKRMLCLLWSVKQMTERREATSSGMHKALGMRAGMIPKGVSIR